MEHLPLVRSSAARCFRASSRLSSSFLVGLSRGDKRPDDVDSLSAAC
jgi:hypothetical protein